MLAGIYNVQNLMQFHAKAFSSKTEQGNRRQQTSPPAFILSGSTHVTHTNHRHQRTEPRPQLIRREKKYREVQACGFSDERTDGQRHSHSNTSQPYQGEVNIEVEIKRGEF